MATERSASASTPTVTGVTLEGSVHIAISLA